MALGVPDTAVRLGQGSPAALAFPGRRCPESGTPALGGCSLPTFPPTLCQRQRHSCRDTCALVGNCTQLGGEAFVTPKMPFCGIDYFKQVIFKAQRLRRTFGLFANCLEECKIEDWEGGPTWKTACNVTEVWSVGRTPARPLTKASLGPSVCSWRSKCLFSHLASP